MAENHNKKKLNKDEVGAGAGAAATLPEDLVIDIITRLPAKSLLRFKSVCKQWKSMIQEPTFITLHQKRAHARSDGGRLIVSIYDDHDQLHLFSAPHEGGPTYPLLPPNHCPQLTMYRASPSTHGLILLFPKCLFTTQAFIFNPTTREIVPLPPLDMNEIKQEFQKIARTESLSFRLVNYHLGFDPFTGTYKVLTISTVTEVLRTSEKRIYCNFFHIFTLGTKEWRKIGTPDLPPAELVAPDSCCVNGSIYFKANPNPSDNHGFLAAFDVGEERFRWVPSPQFAPLYRIIELGGRLALRECRNLVWILEDDKWISVKLEVPCEGSLYPIVGGIRLSNEYLHGELQIVDELVWVYYFDKSGKELCKFQITGLPVKPNAYGSQTNSIETLFSPSASASLH